MGELITKKDLGEDTTAFTLTLKALTNRMNTLIDNMNKYNQQLKGERKDRNRVSLSGKYYVGKNSSTK